MLAWEQYERDDPEQNDLWSRTFPSKACTRSPWHLIQARQNGLLRVRDVFAAAALPMTNGSPIIHVSRLACLPTQMLRFNRYRAKGSRHVQNEAALIAALRAVLLHPDDLFVCA